MKRILVLVSWIIILGAGLPATAQELPSDSLVHRWMTSQHIRITSGNSVRLLKSGREKFDALFDDVRRSAQSVHLEYFNFRNDSIANALFNLLSVKAKQGVEVRALYDAFGNMSNNRPLKKRHVQAIRETGVDLVKWDPIVFPWLNHIFPRDHRKIVVIDGKVAYTGGMNVADYYLVGLPELGPWRDMHIRMEGPVVDDLQHIFLETWNRETGQQVQGDVYFTRSEGQQSVAPVPVQALNRNDSLLLHLSGTSDEWALAVTQADSLLKVRQGEDPGYVAGPLQVAHDAQGQPIHLPPTPPSQVHQATVGVLNRVPRRSPSIMRDFYVAALDAAQHKVQLINPYFIPTRKVRNALKRAVARGVDVQILMPSLSDIPLTPDVAYRVLNKLRKCGATIYLYDGGFHHSKIMMVDDRFCTVGSTNLDARSLRYDYEVNAVILNEGVTAELVQMFEQDKKNSRLLTPEVWKQRSGWSKFRGWFGSLLTWCL